MTLQEFINKYNGKFVEAGGSANAKFQCVDLVNQYITEVLNKPKILWTDAINFHKKAVGYDWILNIREAVPFPGDIIIWDMGKYGHISIFVDGDVDMFHSFDQNYPVGTSSHIQKHNYNKVLGWLRPKGETMTPAEKAELTKLRVDVDYLANVRINKEIQGQYDKAISDVHKVDEAQQNALKVLRDEIEVLKQNTCKCKGDVHTESESEAISWVGKIVEALKNLKK